jgi:RluA family pseudouridine synthase
MINELPDLIFQSQDLLIINKPAGLLSVPDGYNVDLPHLRSILEPIYGELWMVHRLDKDTSGVLVLARNKEAHQRLNEIFREREVNKVYHCLVYPKPDWTDLDIQLPLHVDADRKHRTRVDNTKGKPARSVCHVLKHFKFGALMEINIYTGITHQIRAHLREFNFAILGDDLYSAGLPPQPAEVSRMMLHAREITFPNLISGELVKYTANYPDDFRQTYTDLRTTTNLDEAFLSK